MGDSKNSVSEGVVTKGRPLRSWATLVVTKGVGGRSRILNTSNRGIFNQGATYYNHSLKGFPTGARMNVVVRLSKTGRKMVQELYVVELPNE